MAAPDTEHRTGKTNQRCPHVIFRDVFGAPCVAELLDYVLAREADFRPGKAWNRQLHEGKVDLSRRDCLILGDLGRFEIRLKTFLQQIAPTALAELHIEEPAVEPLELEICAYGDGGHFHTHIDTLETPHRVRVLSCVYYFAATPRRFTGGELRLHGFPSRSGAEENTLPFVDVVPETDTLVAFPTWMRHEVLPVRVPSDNWKDRRFAINCWIHRAFATEP